MENNNLALLSLVAVVAIVGVIGLVMMTNGGSANQMTPTYTVDADGNLAGDAKVYSSSSSLNSNRGICSWSAQCLVSTDSGYQMVAVSGSALNSQYSGSCSDWGAGQATSACGDLGALVEPDSLEVVLSSNIVLEKLII